MECRRQDWYQEPVVNIIYKLVTNQGVSHLDDSVAELQGVHELH